MMHGRKFGPRGPGGRHGRGWNAEIGQKFARAFAEAAFEGAVGKRRGRMFRRGELRLVLLHLIAEEPRHGYDLIRQIEEMTGGHYAPSPGIVYPTLTLMAEMDLIDETIDHRAWLRQARGREGAYRPDSRTARRRLENGRG